MLYVLPHRDAPLVSNDADALSVMPQNETAFQRLLTALPGASVNKYHGNNNQEGAVGDGASGYSISRVDEEVRATKLTCR